MAAMKKKTTRKAKAITFAQHNRIVRQLEATQTQNKELRAKIEELNSDLSSACERGAEGYTRLMRLRRRCSAAVDVVDCVADAFGDPRELHPSPGKMFALGNAVRNFRKVEAEIDAEVMKDRSERGGGEQSKPWKGNVEARFTN